jgi:micrococcal nuclease
MQKMKMLCFMTCVNAFWGSKNDDVNWHNTVPFVPPVTSGKVIKVYDGDTITIATKLPMANSPVYRFPVRLTGIDSPEIKGKSEAEIALAKQSRDSLHELIYGKTVKLGNVSMEKYGRLLADVYLNDVHVNQWMLDNKYAIPYDGGTKSRPAEWN